MSRCFPFPPPGYVLNGIRDEAVIESSIKGAEEKAKKEQRRKEKKREKKEKREKKKEKKRKEREGKEGESEKRSHKRRRKEEEEVAKDDQNKKVDVFRKLKEGQTECVEKSSLTVERELLQSTSQNSCDSTLNSNELPKQKEKQQQQQQQTLDGKHNNDSESIIRIRLPIRRQRDPEEAMMTNKDQQNLCSSRGIKLHSSQPVDQHTCSTSAPGHASKPCEVKRKDTKLGKEKISIPTPETTVQQPSSLCSICPPSLALQFLDVVENWVPNTIEIRRVNSEDEECWWLSKKPSNNKFGTERCKQLNNEMKEVSCSMAWPRARLLPEADVHALPYTVPF